MMKKIFKKAHSISKKYGIMIIPDSSSKEKVMMLTTRNVNLVT
jgi:hypothetical protein